MEFNVLNKLLNIQKSHNLSMFAQVVTLYYMVEETAVCNFDTSHTTW